MIDDNSKKQLDRNLKGISLEKSGDIDEAMRLYEENVAECFEGNHPYDRLSVIYHRRGLYHEEERVLLAGINVFQALIFAESPRSDLLPKLDKFKIRLKKVQTLIIKEQEAR